MFYFSFQPLINWIPPISTSKSLENWLKICRGPLVWDFRYSHLSTATKSMNSTFDNDKILLLDLPLRMRPTECSNNFKHHLHNKYFFGDFIYFICIVGWERLERPKCLDVYIFDCHFLKAVFNLFSKQYLFTARINCNPACLVFIQLFLFSNWRSQYVEFVCYFLQSLSFKRMYYSNHTSHIIIWKVCPWNKHWLFELQQAEKA